jgi:hypothetical protein
MVMDAHLSRAAIVSAGFLVSLVGILQGRKEDVVWATASCALW